MSSLEVEPLHSGKVVRVFLCKAHIGIVTHLQWVMESHSPTWAFTHPSSENQLSVTISQGSTNREVLIHHSGHHF